MKKNILVIGSGGREHAIVKALKRSPQIGKLYCSPANAGIVQDAILPDIDPDKFDEVADFCQAEKIDFVVIGPEQPLVDGIVDYLEGKGIKVFGPNKIAAQLEASKDFMKMIVSKYNVPTAAYEAFTDKQKALDYINKKGAPIVIKADGLAAGKGVTVAITMEDALNAVEEAFAGKFGDAGKKLVIEEFLAGEEASYFVICDGKNYKEFGYAQDHKRAFDDDKGPNTGGMGTYSPAPIVTDEVRKKTLEKIIKPTIEGLRAEGIEYKGFLFAGLMIENGEPKLIEYNIRMGDPETQTIFTRLESDFIEIIEKVIDGNLNQLPEINFSDKYAVCVVMAAKGYPGQYQKGHIIDVSQATKISDVTIYHAGTVLQNGTLKSSGGRVLGVTATGATIKEARHLAYNAINIIGFEGGFCRRDIAKKAYKSN